MNSYPALVGVLALAVAACTERPPESGQVAGSADSTPAVTPASVMGREWVLVSFSEHTDPLGAGGRPLTLRLDSAESRASGFSGCNRYTGPFTLAGDSLRFGSIASTRMACPDVGAVEQNYMSMLAAITSFAATDTTLTLNAADSPLARFRIP